MPPKNFDAEREQRAAQTRDDREFLLGGETFHALAEVAPEVLSRFESIDEAMGIAETLAIVDETILSLTEDEPDDGHARYRRVRETTNVGTTTLLEMAKWLVEVQTGRPTEPPAPSPPSDEAPGTSSTDDSSSPDEPEE